MLYQPAGVEGHGEALATALGVPDHAAALVPQPGDGLDGLVHSGVHRVELVISGQLLDGAGTTFLKHDEMADDADQPGWLEDPA